MKLGFIISNSSPGSTISWIKNTAHLKTDSLLTVGTTNKPTGFPYYQRTRGDIPRVQTVALVSVGRSAGHVAQTQSSATQGTDSVAVELLDGIVGVLFRLPLHFAHQVFQPVHVEVSQVVVARQR